MSYRSHAIQAITNYAAISISDRLTPGALVSASVAAHTFPLDPLEAFAQVFVAESTPDREHLVQEIAHGYFGSATPLSWNGAIPISDDHFICLTVWMPAGRIARITWWTADKLTAATGFPRDP